MSVTATLTEAPSKNKHIHSIHLLEKGCYYYQLCRNSVFATVGTRRIFNFSFSIFSLLVRDVIRRLALLGG